MNIDLSKFNNVNLEEESYKSTFRMQKIEQLKESIDTLQQSFTEEQMRLVKTLEGKVYCQEQLGKTKL